MVIELKKIFERKPVLIGSAILLGWVSLSIVNHLNPQTQIHAYNQPISLDASLTIQEEEKTVTEAVRASDDTSLTDKQFDNLILARNIGSPDNMSLAMMGICMQETLCGETSLVGDKSQPVGKRSYGIMQLKVAATKDVLKRFPELGSFGTDEEIIAKLLTDNEWNMKVAKGYIAVLKERGLAWREVLTAYNLGYNGMRRVKNPLEYKYTRDIVKNVTKGKIKKFRQVTDNNNNI